MSYNFFRRRLSLFAGCFALLTATYYVFGKASMVQAYTNAINIHKELTTRITSAEKLSNYVEHHNQYQDVFMPRKKLLQYACTHMKQILVNSLDYTHEVGND